MWLIVLIICVMTADTHPHNGDNLNSDGYGKIEDMVFKRRDTMPGILRSATVDLKTQFKLKIDQTDDIVEKLNLIEKAQKIIQTNRSEVRTYKQLTSRLREIVETYQITAFDRNQFDDINKYENEAELLESSTVPSIDHVNSTLMEFGEFFDQLEKQMKLKVQEQNIIHIFNGIGEKILKSIKIQINQTNGHENRLKLIQMVRNWIESAQLNDMITNLTFKYFAGKIKLLVEFFNKNLEFTTKSNMTEELENQLLTLEEVLKIEPMETYSPSITARMIVFWKDLELSLIKQENEQFIQSCEAKQEGTEKHLASFLSL